MDGYIKLSDALKIMEGTDSGGEPIRFDFERVTCNLREGTGGERKQYTGAYLLAGGNSSKDSKKNPNNWMNVTRTIQLPGRSRPSTIPVLLITKFNDEKVYI